MSEKAETKSTKAAKNNAAQENPAPLADVIVADSQANESRPAEDPAAVQGDAPVRLNVRAVSENGFWRCGRFWSHAGEDVEVTAEVAARLMVDPDLIVRKEE
ncbi:hypothetical protein AH580_07450 [Salmonella enterica subsp. enterica serovar Montevideo]|nr:hypothetical protein [Salmonella enterica subsp. enterica serovar Montevideo]ECA5183621.1 hypothetical protein [Salmonella enterica subsp. enterica serovar Newport]ECD4584667.1 hypothetical protein [Salmonella enterica subsp. enterica serovar Newport]EDE7747024.1 hypothetical protein [Salmonella enterica subsp. enterica serovar Montevideo]EEK7291955.1 hypothetical protein [Salmonella enterica subsp. enterica serovar Montevideo]